LIPISEFEVDYTFLKKKKSNLPPPRHSKTSSVNKFLLQ